VQNSAHSPITDKAYLISIIVGGCIGFSVPLFRGIFDSLTFLFDPAKLQLLVLLLLSTSSGFVAALIARKQFLSQFHSPGMGSRLGIKAGLFCALLAGGTLTFMATMEASVADSATSDRVLRTKMWLVLAVSLASLLPSVLCGFVGGLIGSQFSSTGLPHNNAQAIPEKIPWLRWAQYGVAGLAFLALASPLSFVGRATKVDPLPVVIVPESPPPFQYEAPAEMKRAKVGQIQHDFTKTIEGVADDFPISLSDNGKLLAYCDQSSNGVAVTVFDLDDFKRIASFNVPVFPKDNFAWSPDQRSLACAINHQDGGHRLWILQLDSQQAIELPNPRSRDTPQGNLSWWQDREVGFFPDDEPPLVLDLDTLILKSAEESAFISKFDESTKKIWLAGPIQIIPSTAEWRLSARTVIHSVEPPPRLDLDAAWGLKGETICALAHPELPLSYGFTGLSVTEGMRVLSAADGSKVIRIHDGLAEIAYMKMAIAPDLQIEVTMPVSADEIKETSLKQALVDHELCAFVYEPLINPLTGQPVGPDYGRVKCLVRLLKWSDKQAVFFAQTYEQELTSTDVISTLHTWDGGSFIPWNPKEFRPWWAKGTILQGSSFNSLAIKEGWHPLSSPSLLTLDAQETSIQVIKQLPIPKKVMPVESMPLNDFRSAPAPVSETRVFAEPEVIEFIKAHHAKASAGNVAGMVADYHIIVNFLDKGQILPEQIQEEEMAHRQKWPTGSESILGVIKTVRNSDVWGATYSIEFYNENSIGDWHRGKADLTMIIAPRDGKLRILEQKAKVYDVVDSRTSAPKTPTSATDATIESKSVSISVPRPCFITVTRAKDTPQIEFTDQISFVKGIIWHRTYRELSSVGKVLRSCRAIYTGSGGVSQDRNTARIYVTTQEWDRNFGDGMFTGVCQRSAESMVGKAFQFEFVNGGMVESQLGMVFQFQK
jgi:hypothetical protein